MQGWDLGTRRPAYIGEVTYGGSALAVTLDTLWVASDEADVVSRFRLP